MKQIERETMDDELYKQAKRMASRAGMPLTEPPSTAPLSPSPSSSSYRKDQAEERKDWERQRSTHLYESKKPPIKRGVTVETGKKTNKNISRSALSARTANNSKPDIFMPSLEKGNQSNNLDPKEFADGKKDLQDELNREINGSGSSNNNPQQQFVPENAVELAAAKTSEIVAKAGAGKAFEGQSLGIGGLDDVLGQIKRRIWVPLAGKMNVYVHLCLSFKPHLQWISLNDDDYSVLVVQKRHV